MLFADSANMFRGELSWWSACRNFCQKYYKHDHWVKIMENWGADKYGCVEVVVACLSEVSKSIQWYQNNMFPILVLFKGHMYTKTLLTLFWIRCFENNNMVCSCNDVQSHFNALFGFIIFAKVCQYWSDTDFSESTIFCGILEVIWRVRDIWHVFTTYCIIISYTYDNNVVYLCKNDIYLMQVFIIFFCKHKTVLFWWISL